jgi:hypothetical protein
MIDLATKYIETGDMVRVVFYNEGRKKETLEGEFIGVATDLGNGEPILLICEEDKSTFQSVGFDAVVRVEHV